MHLNFYVKNSFAKALLLPCIFMFFSLAVSAQERVLTISGIAKEDGKNLEGAKITLLKNDKAVGSITTASVGRFNFRLDVNSEYIVEVAKEGYVTKKIYFNTAMPDADQLDENFDFVV